MSAMTDYLEDALGRHVLKVGAAYSQPSVLYLALFNVAGFPTDSSGTTNEVSGGGYARQNVSAEFTETATNGQFDNDSDISFPVATGSWGSIFGWAIFDASTAGNSLLYGSWTSTKVIDADDQFKVLAGDLVINWQ